MWSFTYILFSVITIIIEFQIISNNFYWLKWVLIPVVLLFTLFELETCIRHHVHLIERKIQKNEELNREKMTLSDH
ncbi:hypothetical protein [Spiroplasma endosymbiont of Aspidapion aeneum]|uniref:hypothetical protein n=1 Tax=Spiroplasma endosymbiont of Aspidapion aeneum TaxID=3066276 RepID=UPI00313E62D0